MQLIVQRMPKAVRPFSLRVSQGSGLLSLLLWWVIGLPLLSMVGAATITYAVALVLFWGLWRKVNAKPKRR